MRELQSSHGSTESRPTVVGSPQWMECDFEQEITERTEMKSPSCSSPFPLFSPVQQSAIRNPQSAIESRLDRVSPYRHRESAIRTRMKELEQKQTKVTKLDTICCWKLQCFRENWRRSQTAATVRKQTRNGISPPSLPSFPSVQIRNRHGEESTGAVTIQAGTARRTVRAACSGATDRPPGRLGEASLPE